MFLMFLICAKMGSISKLTANENLNRKFNEKNITISNIEHRTLNVKMEKHKMEHFSIEIKSNDLTEYFSCHEDWVYDSKWDTNTP